MESIELARTETIKEADEINGRISNEIRIQGERARLRGELVIKSRTASEKIRALEEKIAAEFNKERKEELEADKQWLKNNVVSLKHQLGSLIVTN